MELIDCKRWVSEIPVDFLDGRGRNISLIWNRDDAKEVEIAKKRFVEYSEKGWVAFMVTPDGKKIQVHRFDPKLEKVILIPVAEGG